MCILLTSVVNFYKRDGRNDGVSGGSQPLPTYHAENSQNALNIIQADDNRTILS